MFLKIYLKARLHRYSNSGLSLEQWTAGAGAGTGAGAGAGAGAVGRNSGAAYSQPHAVHGTVSSAQYRPHTAQNRPRFETFPAPCKTGARGFETAAAAAAAPKARSPPASAEFLGAPSPPHAWGGALGAARLLALRIWLNRVSNGFVPAVQPLGVRVGALLGSWTGRRAAAAAAILIPNAPNATADGGREP
jgi:hypothetical protein